MRQATSLRQRGDRLDFARSLQGAVVVLCAMPSLSFAGLLVTAEAPRVQESLVSGVHTFDFNGLSLGSHTTSGAIDSFGTYTASGSGFSIQGPNEWGGSNQTNYMAVGAQSGQLSVTLTLSTARNYIGIYWPAGDSGNYLDVYSGSTLLAQYSLGRLKTLLPTVETGNPGIGSYNGNPNTGVNTTEPYAYVNFFGTNGTTFDKLIFRNASTSTGFETDNHSVATGAAPRGFTLEDYPLLTDDGDTIASGWVTPTVDLGAIHVNGDFIAKSVHVDNSGDANDGNLDAAWQSNTSNLNVTSKTSISGLTPKDTPKTVFNVDINATSVAGEVTGTVVTNFAPDNPSTGTTTVTGMVYSGKSTWNLAGGGSWGGDPQLAATHDNWRTSAGGTEAGAPGVWTGFTNVDTATFGNALNNPQNTAVVTVDSTVSLKSITFNNTEGETYTIAPGTGSLTLRSGSGPAAVSDSTGGTGNSITAPISLRSNLDVSVTNGGKLTVSQLLQGGSTARTVTKTGDGTLLLSGSSTYTGLTTVSAGALRVDGTLTASAVEVKNGATLSGVDGTISNTVRVESGATISPGGDNAATEVSTLTTGAEIWKNGGTYVATISGATDASVTEPNGNSDLLDMTSLTVESGFNITLSSSNVGGVPTGFNPQPGSIYDWIIGKVAGEVDFLPYIHLTTDFDTAHPYRFSMFVIDNTDDAQPDYVVARYTYSAVPEATSMALALTACTPLVLHRRRRRVANV